LKYFVAMMITVKPCLGRCFSILPAITMSTVFACALWSVIDAVLIDVTSMTIDVASMLIDVLAMTIDVASMSGRV